LGDRTGGVGGEVNDIIRQTELVGRQIGRSGWMNKDHGAPPFQLFEQRLEAFFAQVDAVCVRNTTPSSFKTSSA